MIKVDPIKSLKKLTKGDSLDSERRVTPDNRLS